MWAELVSWDQQPLPHSALAYQGCYCGCLLEFKGGYTEGNELSAVVEQGCFDLPASHYTTREVEAGQTKALRR